MSRLAQLPGYRRLWAAATISSFGTYVTALALQILAAVTLHATATQLGLLNAARWLPYLLIGLLAGVLVDRHRRKPVLVGTDLGRAALLCAIPLLYLAGRLSIPALIVVVAAFGTLSLFFDAADQSFLPRLVPARLLTSANARLDQSDAVAQTAGGGPAVRRRPHDDRDPRPDAPDLARRAPGRPWSGRRRGTRRRQLLYWLAMGIEGPNEMGYRQSVTPDRLQGRMNTTIRSFNRAAIVVGAPLGGLIADAASYRTALWVGIVGLAVSAVVLACSPFRHADHTDAALEPTHEA